MDKPFSSGPNVEDHGGAHQRAEPRDSLFLQARLTREGAEAMTLRIRNLSSGGMMADCAAPIERGEKVMIEIRGIGAVEGQIAWSHEQKIGVAFATRVDPKLARMPVRAGTGNEQILPRPTVAVRRPGLRTE